VKLKWVDMYGKCEVLVSILREALNCEIALRVFPVMQFDKAGYTEIPPRVSVALPSD
jgi:hypothetical protein